VSAGLRAPSGAVSAAHRAAANVPALASASAGVNATDERLDADELLTTRLVEHRAQGASEGAAACPADGEGKRPAPKEMVATPPRSKAARPGESAAASPRVHIDDPKLVCKMAPNDQIGVLLDYTHYVDLAAIGHGGLPGGRRENEHSRNQSEFSYAGDAPSGFNASTREYSQPFFSQPVSTTGTDAGDHKARPFEAMSAVVLDLPGVWTRTLGELHQVLCKHPSTVVRIEKLHLACENASLAMQNSHELPMLAEIIESAMD